MSQHHIAAHETALTQGPLTQAQIAQYYREGYLVVPGLVPLETVQQAREAFTAPVAGKGWTPSIFDYDNPDDANVLQHRILVEPNIIAAAEQIFEAPARVFYGMTAVVPANGGSGLPWHQDNQYSQVLFDALNTFVALCDITPDKAILWVAPESHKRGTQPSKAAENLGGHREAAVAPENGRPLQGLKAGDVCIFDRNTYHRSLKNETAEDRFAYAAQYMASHSRMAETGEKPLNKPLARDLQERWQAKLDAGL